MLEGFLELLPTICAALLATDKTTSWTFTKADHLLLKMWLQFWRLLLT